MEVRILIESPSGKLAGGWAKFELGEALVFQLDEAGIESLQDCTITVQEIEDEYED